MLTEDPVLGIKLLTPEQETESHSTDLLYILNSMVRLI